MCETGTAEIGQFSYLLSLGVDPDIHDKVLFSRKCCVWGIYKILFSICRMDGSLSGGRVDIQELTYYSC